MEFSLGAEAPPEGRVDPEGDRRYEMEPVAFHRRVRAGYLEMARSKPDRWRVVDATRSVDEVADEVWRHVSERLPRPDTRTAAAEALQRTARP